MLAFRIVLRVVLSFALIGSLHVQAAQAQTKTPTELVLRPEPQTRSLAQQAKRILERRSSGEVVIGSRPPAGLPEAVNEGQIALLREADAIRLVFVDASGKPHSARLSTKTTESSAMARALALAVESMEQAAGANHSVRRERDDTKGDDADRPDPMGPLGHRGRTGEMFERNEYEPDAKPTIYLRLLVGMSPLRKSLLLGPGTGLGLCVDRHCVVIEGDVSLLPQYSRGQDGTEIKYRSVNTSLRVQLRPFEWDAFVPGVTFGLLSRMGTATLVGTDDSRFVTNLGVRSSGELAWRFAPPFEWVVEAGVDVALTRARFLTGGGRVFLEDRWTPWVVSGLRVRP